MDKRAGLNDAVYRRLREIVVQLDDGDREEMRRVELTPSQANLLQLLEGPDSAGHTITKLAELTLCTRGNTTRLVQRLVEQGLVEIRGDRADQRLVRVVLTPVGVRRIEAARAAHAELNAKRFSALSDVDMSALLAQLTALAEGLRTHLATR